MTKLTKTLLKDKFLVIAILVTIAIAYLSLIKSSNISVGVKVSDKVQHSVAYFTLTLCWLLSFRNLKTKDKIVIAFLCLIYGIIIEALQGILTTYRTADYLDVVANTVGVVLALAIFNQISKKNQFN